MHVLFFGFAHLLQMLFINVHHFGHQQERTAPARAIDLVFFFEHVVFVRGTDAALHGHAQVHHVLGHGATTVGQGLGQNSVQLVAQVTALLLELFEHRTEQRTLATERMAATVEARLDAVFAHPQALASQQFALHHGRAEIAHLQDDAFADFTLLVGKEIAELGQIVEQPTVQSRRQNQRRLQPAVGVSAQRAHGIGERRRQQFAVAHAVTVQLGHDVHVDGAGTEFLFQHTL